MKKNEEKKAKPKIAILTPTRDGQVDCNYTATLTGIINLLGDEYEIKPSIIQGVSDIARGRSRLWNMWYQTDVDYCLWIDSDIAFRPQELKRMLHSNLAFVALNYAKKQNFDEAFLRSAHLLQQSNGDIDPVKARQASYTYVSTGEHKLFSEGEFEGIVTCDGVGFGAVLIHRDGADLIMNWAKNNLPEVVFDPINEGGKDIVGYHVFETEYGEDGSTLGEDFSFCKRYKKAGGQICLIADALVRHAGFTHYDGNFQSYLDVMQLLPKGEKPLHKNYSKK